MPIPFQRNPVLSSSYNKHRMFHAKLKPNYFTQTPSHKKQLNKWQCWILAVMFQLCTVCNQYGWRGRWPPPFWRKLNFQQPSWLLQGTPAHKNDDSNKISELSEGDCTKQGHECWKTVKLWGMYSQEKQMTEPMTQISERSSVTQLHINGLKAW